MAEELSISKSENKVINSCIKDDAKFDKNLQGFFSQRKQDSWINGLFRRKISIKVKKPLIPLKASLFFWFGAGSSVFPFIQVFLKQRGLTIAQISFIYMLNPCVQFLGPVLSGIIADKLGRSKPVLLGNIVLSTLLLSSMLSIPTINVATCRKDEIRMTCNPERVVVEGSNGSNITGLGDCESECPSNQVYERCKSSNKTLYREISGNGTGTFRDITLSMRTLNSNSTNFACHGKVTFSDQNDLQWCQNSDTQICNLTCRVNFTSEKDNVPCETVLYDNSTLVFYMSMAFVVLFHTVTSTAYRIFDFTVMSMIITYDSDFGRERFWSIAGTLVFSIFSGYVIDITSEIGGPKNYNTAIYLSDIVVILAILAIYKLEVQIQPPGKQMLKKSISLLKNPDILAFTIVVLVLGTCWCFARQFCGLYLDTLGASSILLGLNPALNSLFGLPFLVSSNFWVDKIGSSNLLICGLAGHTMFFIGYACLVNPWWSLVLELAGILNYHLLWVAVIRHSHDIAPEGLVATVISTAGALHFAVGKGTGSILGGLTMSQYGALTAFKVMAATSLSVGIMYAIYLFSRHLCFNNQFKTSSSVKDKMEAASYSKTEATICAINISSPTVPK